MTVRWGQHPKQAHRANSSTLASRVSMVRTRILDRSEPVTSRLGQQGPQQHTGQLGQHDSEPNALTVPERHEKVETTSHTGQRGHLQQLGHLSQQGSQHPLRRTPPPPTPMLPTRRHSSIAVSRWLLTSVTMLPTRRHIRIAVSRWLLTSVTMCPTWRHISIAVSRWLLTSVTMWPARRHIRIAVSRWLLTSVTIWPTRRHSNIAVSRHL